MSKHSAGIMLHNEGERRWRDKPRSTSNRSIRGSSNAFEVPRFPCSRISLYPRDKHHIASFCVWHTAIIEVCPSSPPRRLLP